MTSDNISGKQSDNPNKLSMENVLGEAGAIRNFTVFFSKNLKTGIEKNTLPEELKKNMKDARLVWIEQKANTQADIEHELFILNLIAKADSYPKASAFYADKYNQASFIYAKFKDGKLHSYLYEAEVQESRYLNKKRKKKQYVLIEECVGYRTMENGYCAVVGEHFRYTFSKTTFEEVGKTIISNVEKAIALHKERCGWQKSPESVLNLVTEGYGFTGYMYRVLYGELLNGISLQP